MARYIDLDKLTKLVEAKADTLFGDGKNAFSYIAKWLNLLPTADVEEIKYGKWTKVDVIGNGYGQRYYQHKECTIGSTELYECHYERCPRCGAKMDGGKE